MGKTIEVKNFINNYIIRDVTRRHNKTMPTMKSKEKTNDNMTERRKGARKGTARSVDDNRITNLYNDFQDRIKFKEELQVLLDKVK